MQLLVVVCGYVALYENNVVVAVSIVPTVVVLCRIWLRGRGFRSSV